MRGGTTIRRWLPVSARTKAPTSPSGSTTCGGLKPLLDRFGNEPGLTVVVYTLDETTYSRELAPLAGHYPALRLGPPWWFFDSPEGIRRFYHSVVETAGFANTVGFNDDARSLLSIPARHDVARRLASRLPGRAGGRAPPGGRGRGRDRRGPRLQPGPPGLPGRTMKTVVLVGLMGSGKSTVGALVAQRTGRELVDVDVVITARMSKTVRELWEEGGEAAYRYLESDVVLEVLRDDAPTVLAAPGGVVLDPVVRAALADSFVVWLRTSPSTLAGRVRPGDHRPLLGDSPAETFAAMAGHALRALPAGGDRDPRYGRPRAGSRRGRRGRAARPQPRRTPDTNATGRHDAATTGHHHARDQAARRHLELHGRRGRRGPDRGLVAGHLPDARRMPVPSSFNDVLVDPAAARPCRRRLVPAARSSFPAAGPDSASCSGSTRRPTAPRCGSATTLRRRARGRLHALRGRRDRPRRRRARSAGSLSSSTTSSRGSRSRRAWSRCCPTGPGGSASTTTSSTTPACTAASGCTRRHAPTLTTSRW